MKTYKDLLNKLITLSDEQLNNNIVILEDQQIINKTLNLIIDQKPLYRFNDTNMESYVDFEHEINADQYNSEILVDKYNPIFIIK